ncbi:copper amine oxidase [Paenibacillus solani]|uniref:copper amine oxidase n=1 Tax=Paenibacillus solani TaxID=1705565 RepID=UPI003D2A0348
MKKSAYVIGGVLIGFVLATSTSAFADTVKSLIGKKVTGEYTVIVNGEKLLEKGAIIDGKANVPVRAISDALGADIKVSGKTITVISEGQAAIESTEPSKPATGDNEYIGRTKDDLEKTITMLNDKILNPTKAERETIAKNLEAAKTNEADEQRISTLEKQLELYDADIEKYSNELSQVEAALAAIK